MNTKLNDDNFRNNIKKEAILQQEIQEARRLQALRDVYQPDDSEEDEQFFSSTLDRSDAPYDNQYADRPRFPSDTMLLQKLVCLKHILFLNFIKIICVFPHSCPNVNSFDTRLVFIIQGFNYRNTMLVSIVCGHPTPISQSSPTFTDSHNFAPLIIVTGYSSM